MAGHDSRQLRELELACDGIAAVTGSTRLEIQNATAFLEKR
jgi:hypothetical protein